LPQSIGIRFRARLKGLAPLAEYAKIDHEFILWMPVRKNCKWPFLVLADVAQLVEQRFRKPQVTGSNPVVGSNLCWQRLRERSCHAIGTTDTNRFDSQVIFWATAGQALDRELLESDD
jgi:hypothetical protein